MKPSEIAFEIPYTDKSGIEFGVRLVNDLERGPSILITHVETIEIPLDRLDWLHTTIKEIKYILEQAE